MEVLTTLSSWELKERKCSICNHGTFDVNSIKASKVDYYEGDPEEEKEPYYPWSD